MMRVVKPWHRLPREKVEGPSLETSKASLDGALSNLIQLKMSLLMAGGVDWMVLKGPIQPRALYDSGGVGLGDPQRSLPTPNILRFCDSTALRHQQETEWTLLRRRAEMRSHQPENSKLTAAGGPRPLLKCRGVRADHSSATGPA